jgi:SAM-dependent methyltransferase
LATGTVDAVIAQAVLEHVLDPPRVVGEIHRILRPGGLVYAETAFMQQVHEGPYDFTRYTESGHRWLFRDFEVVDAGALTGPGTQLVWTADYLLRGLTRSQTAGRVAHRILAPLSYLDRFVPLTHSIDNSPAVYFLGRRSESSLSPREMAAYYQGAQ